MLPEGAAYRSRLIYGFTDLDGSQPDAWRYLTEVQDAGKPADVTGYRQRSSAANRRETVPRMRPASLPTVSFWPASRASTSPKATRKTCFIRHDPGLRRCLTRPCLRPSS